MSFCNVFASHGLIFFSILGLRNAPKERPPSDNYASLTTPILTDAPTENPPSLVEEMHRLQELVVPHEDEDMPSLNLDTDTAEKSSSETSDVDDLRAVESDDYENKSNEQTNAQEALESTENTEKTSAEVSMDYVDKCLDILQRLEQPVNALPGVGPKTGESLNKLGLFTLRDLLWYFPRSFIDRSVLESDIRNIPDGELGTFVLTIHKERARHNAVPCTDEEGNAVDIVFIYGGSRQGLSMTSAAKTKLCGSDKMIVSGKVKCSENGYAIFNPDVIESLHNATDVLGIEPVYRLNSGLTQNKLVKAIDGALEVAEELKLLPESLPKDVLDELGWPTFVDSIRVAHKPASMKEAGVDSPARNRLAFEELCIQQARLALARWDMKHSGVEHGTVSGLSEPVRAKTWQESPLVTAAVETLPFELTESQKACFDEIWNSAIVNNNERMTRLLQGDVGSGKTVIAYLAALGCVESRQGGGSVVVFLAPTQLLAIQHYQTISSFAKACNDRQGSHNIQLELLTGSIVGSKREEVLSRIESSRESDATILIGTHALVTPDVVQRLSNLQPVNQSKGSGLALLIVDEEQRFGVRQRQALSRCAANTLYMSATPIPRTLGLHCSGLLDVTNLESDPRQVQTTITTADNIDKLVAVLQTKIKNGSKCFWVLPRIEVTDTDDSSSQQSSVLDRYAMLTEVFGAKTVGHVHGRMSIKDREDQLARFADEESPTSILVSTTVIEVGIGKLHRVY